MDRRKFFSTILTLTIILFIIIIWFIVITWLSPKKSNIWIFTDNKKFEVITIVYTWAKIGPKEIYPTQQNPGLANPDITQNNINETICNPNWSTKSIRPPVSYTNNLKWKQIKEYWYEDTSKKSYEEDHIIPLEVGWHPSDPRNLWPEPYNTTLSWVIIWAKQKDVVENKLHKEVCSGRISLKDAQSIFTWDWYSYYLKVSD